nr:hypothetical protein GCM10020185_44770 [Pseudomonas brassicacearum subsp. brassicacearum]
MPSNCPSGTRFFNGAGQHDRGLAEAELGDAVDQLFQFRHRANRRLHDHARVSGDPVALGQLRDLAQFVVGLLVAMLVHPQFDDALHRQADLRHVDFGLITGDDAAGFQFADPLGYGRG